MSFESGTVCNCTALQKCLEHECYIPPIHHLGQIISFGDLHVGGALLQLCLILLHSMTVTASPEKHSSVSSSTERPSFHGRQTRVMRPSAQLVWVAGCLSVTWRGTFVALGDSCEISKLMNGKWLERSQNQNITNNLFFASDSEWKRLNNHVFASVLFLTLLLLI